MFFMGVWMFLNFGRRNVYLFCCAFGCCVKAGNWIPYGTFFHLFCSLASMWIVIWGEKYEENQNLMWFLNSLLPQILYRMDSRLFFHICWINLSLSFGGSSMWLLSLGWFRLFWVDSIAVHHTYKVFGEGLVKKKGDSTKGIAKFPFGCPKTPLAFIVLISIWPCPVLPLFYPSSVTYIWREYQPYFQSHQIPRVLLCGWELHVSSSSNPIPGKLGKGGEEKDITHQIHCKTKKKK